MTQMLFLKAKTLEQWHQVVATTHAAQAERLQLPASSPTDIAITVNGCTLSAKRPTSISCRADTQPQSVQVDGAEIATKFDDEFSLLRFQVPAGQTQVSWQV